MEIVVPTFGFINNGNICYFNSLLQCIINCKYIMHYLINEQQPKNELQSLFKNEFIKFTKLYNKEDYENFIKETSVFSIKILNLLLKKHKHINMNEQQSSSEFFLYLIEELGIEHFFKMIHQINIHCGNCKNISSKIDESFHFEMFHENNINERISSDENNVDIDTFMYSVNILNDYKCEKCKKVSKSLYEKQALNISKYFVVILNKYFDKVLINYPNTFEITVKNIQNTIESKYTEPISKYITIDNYIPTNCVWENTSQIEHHGNLNSGHYTSVCKRLNSVFYFDDMKVELTEHKKIYPTKNTYMIFYEKQY